MSVFHIVGSLCCCTKWINAHDAVQMRLDVHICKCSDVIGTGPWYQLCALGHMSVKIIVRRCTNLIPPG